MGNKNIALLVVFCLLVLAPLLQAHPTHDMLKIYYDECLKKCEDECNKTWYSLVCKPFCQCTPPYTTVLAVDPR
ncbi:hypothetical protein Lalb_Chr04g0262511 [Lupinus albus]|uniref:Knottin, scorpion toxin n=1 Tax=Lupinus albus TaxID=3870 RepID=A0A6A4QRE5_LUPAL|nr:hypothetical protein Lalb_Chr04g0262511 [Lupinus albus]